MRGDRLARPNRTLLGGRLIADRENEVEARTVRRREFVPTLRAQAAGFVVQLIQQLDASTDARALGMASRAEAPEFSLAPSIDARIRP